MVVLMLPPLLLFGGNSNEWASKQGLGCYDYLMVVKASFSGEDGEGIS
jgi:hypothetical protein